MAKISDIISVRGEKYEVPEYIRAARDTTKGATDELYTNNVIEALGGDKNLPNWIDDVKTVKKPTVPTVAAVLDVLDLHDDEGADKGKGRTALQKFIEDFPSMQKEWKSTVEEDEKWGERGWNTVKDLWKATVHDKMLDDIEKGRQEAVNDGTVRGFITRLLFPRATEHIANTGDFDAKDIALDVGENLAMSVPGAMWTGAPVKAASIVGKGLAKAGLGNTAASRVLANLPGHVTNLSNKLAASWGKTLPGTVALGIGKTGGHFVGNAVVPFAMEGIDDYAYDEGEGMDQRADYSVGDALTGAITNQVVNRSLARLGQAVIPEAAGSVEVRSPAVLKMREILKSLGESSHKTGDDFADAVRATTTQKVRPSGTYTPGEVSKFRNGPANEGGDLLAITPEEKDKAELASTILNAIDNGDIRLQPKNTVNQMTAIGQYTDEFDKGIGMISAEQQAKRMLGEIDRLKGIEDEYLNKIADKTGDLEFHKLNHETGDMTDAEFKKAYDKTREEIKELSRKRYQVYKKYTGMEDKRLELMNTAKRDAEAIKDNAPFLEPQEYFDVDRIGDKLAHFDDAGNYVEGIPYSADEILQGLTEHIPEYTNYANWHGKPSVEPSRMRKILGLTENPTATEVLLNDAKVAVPTWAVNKAGRADMTKNLLRRVDLTDTVKEDQEETHAAPGQRVRSRAAKDILDTNRGELSDKSRKYLAYLAEHPDAVKTGHSDPKERSDFNLWLLTEGRDLLEGTPLHRPTWDIDHK